MRFEWDETKSRINKAKHGVSFEEAATVFADPEALLLPDPDHSRQEERFVLLGISHKPRLLVVCHCTRAEEGVIRLISARKATRKEVSQYRDQYRRR